LFVVGLSEFQGLTDRQQKDQLNRDGPSRQRCGNAAKLSATAIQRSAKAPAALGLNAETYVKIASRLATTSSVQTMRNLLANAWAR